MGPAEAPFRIATEQPVGWKIKKQVVTLVQKVANILSISQEVSDMRLLPSGLGRKTVLHFRLERSRTASGEAESRASVKAAFRLLDSLEESH